MKRLHIFPNKRSQRGQSLVEVALFFPIFLIMLAGLVEIANILVTQNRVTSATRAATRFGADGGEDAGMNTVLLNAVTQTLSLNEDVWDVWIVRGTMNQAGDAVDPTTWQFNHVYGISNTQEFSQVDEQAVMDEVAYQLQRDDLGNQQPIIARNLQFVGTFAIHDIDSILGLNVIPSLVGYKSVKELTVMRVLGFSTQATDSCDAFPIAISDGARSVTPPGTGSNPFPASGDFDLGPNPQYTRPTYQQFINHVPDTPLLNAREGYIYRLYNGFNSTNFGWLRWNTGQTNGHAGNLRTSLTFPGNSRDFANRGANAPAGGAVPGSAYNYPVWGYLEPLDATDETLHIGDWTAASTSVTADTNLRATLNGHIINRRTLRLIIWNQASGGNYLISRFAIFRLQGYNLSQGWILMEFIRWDDSCGQT